MKVIFIIRDGWGHREDTRFNAIFEANTPNDDYLRENYPWTLLHASGESVGLPQGYQGNSEVGHLTIGSGRVIEQNLKRINSSIERGSFFKKEEFLQAIENCKRNESKMHIAGLMQKEGVHAHMDHLYALLELCKRENFKDVFLHVITDGRDAPVNKGVEYLEELQEKLNRIGVGEIVTISGRYYAMDRDKRWDRTKKAYDAAIKGVAESSFTDPLEKLRESYNKGETDEFITPSIKGGYKGGKDEDSFIFYNYRTDRPRQLTQEITENTKLFFVAMTGYYDSMKAKVAFPEEEHNDLLGEVLSDNGIKQLRVSETEKYAHVTFFFNGQKEKELKGERRLMINSPGVSTYDEKPEMSVKEVSDKTIEEIKEGESDFIVVNLVNCDMVGHTGNTEAIIKAVEAVDREVGRIVSTGTSNGYSLFVFADHGNAEDQREEWRTSHTVNSVPFIFVSDTQKKIKKGGGLKDIAPTTLSLLGIEIPQYMTGKVLLK